MAMRKLLLTLCAGMCGLLAVAQPQNKQPFFVKGYFISLKGDTVWGEVKVNPKKEMDVYEKFAFKDPSGAQKNYKPEKVKGYGFDDRNFISLDFDGEPKFYDVLANGPISFYKMVFEAMRMNELSYDSEYYVTKPGTDKVVVVKENKFKKQMTEIMKDNTEFIDKMEDSKDFDAEKATEIIKQYNAWKAGQ